MSDCAKCGRKIKPPKWGFVLTPAGKLYCLDCGIDEPFVREFLGRTSGDEVVMELVGK